MTKATRINPSKSFNQRKYKKELKKFLLGKRKHAPRNVWLRIGKSEIYVRKWMADPSNEHSQIQAFFELTKLKNLVVLDIATLNIHESAQKQGHFKKLLANSEALACSIGYNTVHVECVNNKVIWPHLERSGYKRVPSLDNCYAKVIAAPKSSKQ